MKKIIILITILILTLTSCILFDQNDVYKIDYKKISKLEKPNIILQNINSAISNQSDKEYISRLLFELEESQIKYLNYYNDKIFYNNNHRKIYSFFREGFNRSKLKTIKDEGFRELLSEILDCSYKITKIDKLYGVVIDYDKYKKYKNYMTEEAKLYFHIQIVANRDKKLKNELSVFEIANRIIEADNFVIKYPFSKKINKVILYNTNLFWEIFDGKDNEKIIDKNGYVRLEVVNIYKYLCENIYNKGFNDFLKKYIEYLEEKNYKYDDDTYQFILDNDNFYNFYAVDYKKESVIIEAIDMVKNEGYMVYPEIKGYSNLRSLNKFNKKLKTISYDFFKRKNSGDYLKNDVKTWIYYEMLTNVNGIVSLEIYGLYQFQDINRRDFLSKGISFDLNNGKLITLEDVFPGSELMSKGVMDQIKEYVEVSKYKNYIDMEDFKNLKEFSFLFLEDRVDILYNVELIDGNKLTIRIPVFFDKLKYNTD